MITISEWEGADTSQDMAKGADLYVALGVYTAVSSS